MASTMGPKDPNPRQGTETGIVLVAVTGFDPVRKTLIPDRGRKHAHCAVDRVADRRPKDPNPRQGTET